MIKYYRILASFMFFIVMMLSMITVECAASINPVIMVEKITVETADSVRVPVYLSGNTGICGATISVEYDESLVLTDVEPGTALSSLVMTEPGNLSANPINIVWDGVDADDTNGVIVTLVFRVPKYLGKYDINIFYENGDIVDGNLRPVEIGVENGSITISDEKNEDFPTISADVIASNPGGDIEVPIRILSNTGICGATISIKYDENLILTDITEGQALTTLTMTKPGNLSANPIKLVWDGLEEDNTNGIIAILKFNGPTSKGEYDIALSYEDGDIVDGNLSAVNPILGHGKIVIKSSNEVSIRINSNLITLTGKNNTTGEIIAAFYDINDKLIFIKNYMATDDFIDVAPDGEAVYAKIMWWESLTSLKPVCGSQKIYLK